MTVKELIEELQKCRQESIVKYGFNGFEVTELKIGIDVNKETFGTVVLR